MPAESIFMSQQIRTVSKDRLVQLYGRLEDHGLRTSVKEARRTYLDLEGDREDYVDLPVEPS